MKGLLLIAGSLFSATLFAEHNPEQDFSHLDHATVIESTPVTRLVRVTEPRQHCWDEEITRVERGRSDPGATIVGGLIGAAIGHHIGRHTGARGVGTVAGAVIGGSVAREASRQPNREYTDLNRRCETRDESYDEERVVGYRVVYRYNGETFETRMAKQPGKKIRVRVTVEPLTQE